MDRRRALLIGTLLAGAAVLAVTAATLCGSAGCGWPAASDALLTALRLPRALAAFVVGALLALAGALMQVLLRNPLADPYVLGLSGGAAAGALAALLAAAHFGLGRDGAAAVGAVAGALLALALLLALLRRALRQLSATPFAVSHRLILTGVMIAAGFGALITLMLTLAPDAQLRGMVFWLMGDLEDSRHLLPATLALALAGAWALANAGCLNLLARGESFAQLLGVPVARLRIGTLCAASLATAAAVAVAGTVGFIGLVVPHALRLVCGNDQRLLLPASLLAGGALLTLADLAARTVAAPIQLPVGVITALVGVPVFLWLLARGRA